MKVKPMSMFLMMLAVLPGTAGGQEYWWERGADSWYYKDDWKGLKITGAGPLRLEVDLPAPAVGGWIVVWGDGNGRLAVNDRLIDKDLDPCLIWDYDLAPFLSAGPRHVTLRVDARAACAEGEILSRDGTVHRFVTDAHWVDARGNPVKTERMRVTASRGAFDKAHNGRLLAYNEEERGKSAIAKCLARIQKLREQSVFLMRRFRPAGEIVSFDPNNTGASDKWYEGVAPDGWTTIAVPKPWERQGYNFDNLKSPGDAPYRAPMSGDKPYNGYAWYRKTLLIPESWQGRRLTLRLGRVRDWYRVFVNGAPLGEGMRAGEDRQLSSGESVPLVPEAVRFGGANTIVVQVYNHNNFGGLIAGRPALYLEGQEPQFIETPGPLSYAYESTYRGPGPVSYSALAGAMSPGVVCACDQNSLELWGWQAKGYDLPESIAFAGRSGHETVRLVGSGAATAGERLAEKWLVVHGGGADALLVLEQQPQAITWEKNAQGSMSLVLRFAHGPARAVVLSMRAGVSLDEQQCRFWAALLRKYPVSVSECVRREDAGGSQSCLVRYNYLELGRDERNAAVAGAPVPMLAGFGCQHETPGLTVEGAERTQVDPWLEAILFGIAHHVPIHCGEFGLSMIQPDSDGQTWLNDYLAFFERFCIGWNWWNYSGGDIYRTGLAMGDRLSPYVPILRQWTARSGWGQHGPAAQRGVNPGSQSGGTHE